MNVPQNMQNVIQMALKWLKFDEKSQKLLRPQIFMACGGWGLRPQTPYGLPVSVCIHQKRYNTLR